MTETLCTSGSVKLKAGADATVLTGAQYTELIEQAEGDFIADTGVDWVTAHPTLSGAKGWPAIEGAVAAKAAVSAIGYDPLALGGLQTATTIINKNLDEYDRVVSDLKEIDMITKFGATKIE